MVVHAAGHDLAADLDEPVFRSVASEHPSYLVTGHPLGNGAEVKHHARVRFQQGVAMQCHFVHPDEQQQAVELGTGGQGAALEAESPSVDQRHHCRVECTAAFAPNLARGGQQALQVPVGAGGLVLVDGTDERGFVVGRHAHIQVAQNELDAVAQVITGLIGDVVLGGPHHALVGEKTLTVTRAKHRHDGDDERDQYGGISSVHDLMSSS